MTVNASGTATFGRQGVTASTTVSDVYNKQLDVAASTQLNVNVTGTSSDDTFRIDAPNAGAISFSGDAGAGVDEFVIKVDDTQGGFDQRELKVVTTGVSDGETLGFYPVLTDGYKTLENSRSRLANRRRIRGL